ncbi:PEP-CTERM sorting domain-containing protein [Verrucomicrobia bacterium S94]|nr:PEP-CTERM sorting domain-containing protein [Verrucomicrobia bacterium S94]
MKQNTLIVIALAVAGVVQANLLNNTFTDHNENNHTFSLTDIGWGAKEYWQQSAFGGLESKVPVWDTDGANDFGVMQVISVGANTGSDLVLSFDWTPAATALSNASLAVDYQLVGWTVEQTPDPSDIMFSGINFYNDVVAGNNIAGGTSTAYDFLDGDIPWVHANGTAYPSIRQATSTAGTTLSVSTTNSVAIGGLTDLSDYDYIGVRFTINSVGDAGNVGATIENISLVAIPEPATMGMIAFFGGAVLFVRRRFMM